MRGSNGSSPRTCVPKAYQGLHVFHSGIRTHGSPPSSPHVSPAGWYIFRSPHLLSPSSFPATVRCPALAVSLLLLRFNLNFAPARPKAALRFFKATRGTISRGDLAHLLERFRARFLLCARHLLGITLFPFHEHLTLVPLASLILYDISAIFIIIVTHTQRGA